MNDSERKLRLFYAGALSDAAFYYGKYGIVDKVIKDKKRLQSLTAANQLKQLGIDSIESLYTVFTQIFGCAQWILKEKNDEGVTATTESCLLCSIAEKQGSPKPCDLFCINPFSIFAESLGYDLKVEQTLWDGDRCTFQNKKID